jgi:hypothetical protein
MKGPRTISAVRQIAELYGARAFSQRAGPFQDYSNPKP